MNAQTLRGVVRNGIIVLQGNMPSLAEGTEVLVTPVQPEKGSPAAVLAAVAAPPHVPREWVDELEALIAQGQRPPFKGDPFEGYPDEKEP